MTVFEILVSILGGGGLLAIFGIFIRVGSTLEKITTMDSKITSIDTKIDKIGLDVRSIEQRLSHLEGGFEERGNRDVILELVKRGMEDRK